MDIDLISAELRPRRPWEAVDLGMSLGRRHMGKLLLFWSLSVLPLIAILSVLLWSHYQLLVLIIWWLKPLYDRVPLFYLSRALFGSAPSLRDFFRALPKLWTRRLFEALVVGRLSLVRSVVLPIKELEGLRGMPYRSRRDPLLRTGSSQGQWFTALCLFAEHFFTFGLILFATSAIPVVAPPDPFSYLRSLYELALTGGFALPTAVEIAVLCAWILAMTFTEIFYVAGGFGLYLNARTELEGWDVELTFRRIANRIRAIQSSGMTVLLVAAIAWVVLGDVAGARVADPATEPPGEVIERVLADEDFVIHVEKERVRVSSGSGFDPSALSFLGVIGYALFWGVVAFLVVFAVIMIYKNRHYFLPQGVSSKKTAAESKVRTVLGMEIGANTLPRDIVGAARSAWQEGRKKDALSLLYRGTISWLVLSARAPIRECDTEADCLGHARASAAARTQLPYIEAVTGKWIGLAYGRREPDDHEMESLLQGWPFNQGASDA